MSGPGSLSVHNEVRGVGEWGSEGVGEWYSRKERGRGRGCTDIAALLGLAGTLGDVIVTSRDTNTGVSCQWDHLTVSHT